jgi:hypothetical protein
MFGYVPVFSNLTHLEVVYGRGISWDLIFQVLKNCPILQSFLLDMPSTPNIYFFWFPIILPECLSLLLLTNCTITNYDGQKFVLQFVQHILLISTALESMRVYSSPSLNSQEKLEVVEELMAFPRSSSTCEVYFE